MRPEARKRLFEVFHLVRSFGVDSQDESVPCGDL